MRRTILLSFFFFCCLFTIGQTRPYVSERIFIAPSSGCYDVGDTVEIVGQVLSTDYTDFYPYSRYVYVDVLDGGGNIVKSQKLVCRGDGSFYTAFLMGSLPKGQYNVRGYTRFMCNSEVPLSPASSFFYGEEPEHSDVGVSGGLKAVFFPEGGHLRGGTLQNVGVYVYDKSYRPAKADYYVVKNSRDTVCYGSTDESGWDRMAFIPEDRAVYQLYIRGCHTAYSLPELSAEPTLQTYVNKGRLLCRVLGGVDGLEGCRVLMFHNSFGLKELRVDGGQGMASLAGCGDGPLTVWLVDSLGESLSQRTLWVGSMPLADGGINIATDGGAGDTVAVSLTDSVSPYRAFVRFLPVATQSSVASAYSVLNFTGSLRSPVPAADVFTGGRQKTQAEYKKNLECWLLSAVRPLPDVKLMASDSVKYKFGVESSLSVAGTIESGHHAQPGVNVQVFNAATGDAATGVTGRDGRFDIPVADYRDGDRMYIQASDKYGNPGDYLYLLADDYVPPVVPLPSASVIDDLAQAYSDVEKIDTLNRYNIGNVEITHRAVNKKQYDWARTKSTFSFYDRKFLESHKNFFTVRDAVLYTHKVNVSSDKSNVSWKSSRYFMISEQHVNGVRTYDDVDRSYNPSTVFSEIAFVINGLKINRGIADVLDIPITDVESIELVTPFDQKALWYDTPKGCFDIKLRSGRNAPQMQSNGTVAALRGLSVPLKQQELRLPRRSGRYLMLVDVVSADRTIRSLARTVDVK